MLSGVRTTQEVSTSCHDSWFTPLPVPTNLKLVETCQRVCENFVTPATLNCLVLNARLFIWIMFESDDWTLEVSFSFSTTLV